MAKFSLFGFQLGKDSSPAKEVLPSFSAPVLDDGAVTISAAAHYGTTIDLDSNYKNEVELITRYREMAMQPEIESAVDDIINESIIQDKNKGIKLILDDVKASPKVKKAIEEEFENILTLLNFKNLGQDIFRRYYVDGRIFYNIILDKDSPQAGIQELRYTDPRKLSKIREIKKIKDKTTGFDIVAGYNEYYIYSDTVTTKSNLTNSGVRIAPDSIISVTSGLLDSKRSIVLSYLHKAIKPLNQLRMIEDATVIYKVSRAPERRIFYIDVGNLPKMKAEQYLKDIMTKYKNKVVYNANSGEIVDDRRHLCLSMETKVPLLDGRTLTLSEIAKEYKSKDLWAYSCDPITGKFVPGLITWAGISRPNAEMMRLTLDNGETIDCTPDHKFPVWNKNLVQAKDLIIGDSLIPLYKKLQNIAPGNKKDYEQIWDNESKTWKFTHREVSNWKDSVGLENEFLFNEQYSGLPAKTVHHKNINRFDNSPENLVRMHSKDHIEYHHDSSSNSGKIGGTRCYELGKGFHDKSHPDYINWRIKGGTIRGNLFAELGLSQQYLIEARKSLSEKMEDPEFNLWFRQQQKNGWTEEKRDIASEHAKRTNLSKRGNDAKKELFKTPEKRAAHRKLYAVEYSKQMFVIVNDCAIKQMTGKETLSVLNNSIDIIEEWKQLNANKCLNPKQKTFDILTKHDLSKIVSVFTDGLSFSKLKTQHKYKNHKIVKIEYLNERVDAGCLTIDGDEKYHNYHTFALDAGIYTKNSMQEDFWLPRRDGKGTEISTLPSSAAFDDMSMVQYFEQKLYKALNVPYSRLHQPDTVYDIGNSDQISRDEIKFDKFINRIRLKFSDLFDQALKVQCYLKGVCSQEEFDEYKQNIFYDFLKDNNYAELRESQLLQNRMSVLSQVDPYIGKYYSMSWVQKNVLQFDEKEIEDMQKEIQQEIADGLYPDPNTMNIPQDTGLDQSQQDSQSGSQSGSQSESQPDQQSQDQSQQNPYYNG